MNAIIVDVSQSKYFMLQSILAFAKLHVVEFKGFAFLIRNRLMEITLRLLTFRKKYPYHVKFFKTCNLAVAWSRTLK
jgi:hypothetical protein